MTIPGNPADVLSCFYVSAPAGPAQKTIPFGEKQTPIIQTGQYPGLYEHP